MNTDTDEILDLTRPGIVEASAGAGKTFNIAEIYLALLCGRKFYSPTGNVPAGGGDAESAPGVREIVVVTFTEPATAELSARLRERIRKAITEPEKEKIPLSEKELIRLRLAEAEFDDAKISTIHGFCNSILHEFGFECGMPLNAELCGDIGEERERFARRFILREKLAGRESPLIEDKEKGEDISSLADKLSTLINEMEQVPGLKFAAESASADWDFMKSRADYVRQAFDEWQKFRAEADTISYNEMLTRLLHALEKETSGPRLAKKISARRRVALVDEFQDTDPVQWEIFDKIFVENGLPFFCIGDPKQAIYKFRGGDVETYKKARTRIAEISKGNRLTLKYNWRSSPEMIAAFNEIFSKDAKIEPVVAEKKNKTETNVKISGFLEYSDASAAPRDGVEPPTADSPAIFVRIGGYGARAKLAQAGVQQAVCDDVEALVKTQNVRPSKIAILVRDNKSATMIRSMLARLGVPATTTATSSVLADTEAADFESLMEAILSPRDTAKVRKAALTSFFGDKFRKAVLTQQTAGAEAAELEEFQKTLHEQRTNWEKNGFAAAFAEIANKFDCYEILANSENPKRKITNVRHLSEIINDWERRKNLTPSALAKYFAEQRSRPNKDDKQQSLRAETDSDAVQIQTIHKSKGLEYDIVFLPDLWNHSLDNTRKPPYFVRRGTTLYIKGDRGFKEALVEDRAQTDAAQFYVALTRAVSACVLYHEATTTYYGKPLVSYANSLLAAGDYLYPNEKSPSPHVVVLNSQCELPPIPTSDKVATIARDCCEAKSVAEREKILATVEKRTKNDAFGFFSFTRILGSHNNPATDNNDDENSLAETHAEDKPPENSTFPDDDGGGNNPATTDNNGGDNNATTTTLAGEAHHKAEEKTYHKPGWFDLPAGTYFGSLVHGILEKVNFKTQENLGDLAKNAAQQLTRNGKNPSEIEKKLRAMVVETLGLEICDGAKLSDVDSEKDCVHEMEFLFPAADKKNLCPKLDKVFTEFGGIYERTAERHWRDNSGSHLNIDGFMHGFIDLVARVGERFFIADWKTNRIVARNSRQTTISEADLANEIVANGYALQWMVYAVALRKFLKKIYGDAYDHNKHFGGILYVFVRWGAIYRDASITEEMLDKLEDILSAPQL
ncbi:MAG: UvrD-helicase domain-containing protein [Opitutae bacterium]|nr:UvrD-helicase domain-containing protein [Opitutae bacterium]